MSKSRIPNNPTAKEIEAGFTHKQLDIKLWYLEKYCLTPTDEQLEVGLRDRSDTVKIIFIDRARRLNEKQIKSLKIDLCKHPLLALELIFRSVQVRDVFFTKAELAELSASNGWVAELIERHAPELLARFESSILKKEFDCGKLIAPKRCL